MLPPRFLLLLLLPSLAFAEPVSFRRDIAPLLLDNCLACHGPKKAEGGYRIDSFERLMQAGDSGLAPFTAKALDDSETFRRLVAEDAEERMPLEGQPLSPPQVELFRRWIAEGAGYDHDDPKAALFSITPPPTHPQPPAAYPHAIPITAAVFSQDGKKLYVGGYHEITVWNPENGELLQRLENVGQRTYALRLSQDGKTLAVGCGAPGKLGEVRLLDLTQEGRLLRVFGKAADVVLDLQFSPDGKQIAAAAADNLLRVYQVESGEMVREISSHSNWVTSVAFSPDSQRLASGSRDKTVKVFDLKNGELQTTYTGHSQTVQGVAFHPDGDTVFSSSADHRVHQWKIADGKKIADVASFGDEVHKLATGGGFFFAASNDKSVRQFEAKTRKTIRTYSGHQDAALSAAFHAASQRLASGGFDGRVYIWNTQDGQLITQFIAAPGYAAN